MKLLTKRGIALVSAVLVSEGVISGEFGSFRKIQSGQPSSQLAVAELIHQPKNNITLENFSGTGDNQ